MSRERLGKYMYVFCLFDLPTQSKRAKRSYTVFRRRLQQSGFVMMQYSVYVAQIRGTHQTKARISKVKNFAPKNGEVRLLTITDRQFDKMEIIVNFEYTKSDESLSCGQQLIIEF